MRLRKRSPVARTLVALPVTQALRRCASRRGQERHAARRLAQGDLVDLAGDRDRRDRMASVVEHRSRRCRFDPGSPLPDHRVATQSRDLQFLAKLIRIDDRVRRQTTTVGRPKEGLDLVGLEKFSNANSTFPVQSSARPPAARRARSPVPVTTPVKAVDIDDVAASIDGEMGTQAGVERRVCRVPGGPRTPCASLR